MSILEAVVGLIFLVPIVLLAVDATCLLSAERANQELAHNIARSAANQRTSDAAEQAARAAVDSFEKPSLIHQVSLSQFSFDATAKVVTITTTMDVTMPVPCPGMDTVHLSARWSEPIVALPAST